MFDRFWLILREPHCVPERKGSWPIERLKSTLVEFMSARPGAFITVLTVDDDYTPLVQDAPEALMMLDFRYRYRARRHIASSTLAHGVPRGGAST